MMYADLVVYFAHRIQLVISAQERNVCFAATETLVAIDPIPARDGRGNGREAGKTDLWLDASTFWRHSERNATQRD